MLSKKHVAFFVSQSLSSSKNNAKPWTQTCVLIFNILVEIKIVMSGSINFIKFYFWEKKHN